jgi:hypothetical protein
MGWGADGIIVRAKRLDDIVNMRCACSVNVRHGVA